MVANGEMLEETAEDKSRDSLEQEPSFTSQIKLLCKNE